MKRSERKKRLFKKGTGIAVIGEGPAFSEMCLMLNQHAK